MVVTNCTGFGWCGNVAGAKGAGLRRKLEREQSHLQVRDGCVEGEAA